MPNGINFSRITSLNLPGGSHRKPFTSPLPASGSPSSASKPESRNVFGQKVFDWLIVALVALMPFHAFASVWLGSLTGHQALVQVWKEVVLLILVALVPLLHSRTEIIAILKRRTNLVIAAFAILALGISLVNGVWHTTNFWYGLKTDMEFLLAFMLAQFVTPRIRQIALFVFLGASTLVAAFGALQVLVLPNNFLTHFGYGTGTLPPFMLVDPAVSVVRILSTLGGPNQLGSFLILPICLMLYLAVKRHQWIWVLPVALALFTLWHSYSRSAEIGLIAAIGFMIYDSISRRWKIATVATGLVVLILALTLGRTYLATHNTQLEFYLFHGQIVGDKIFGSDAGRAASIRNGVTAVSELPFGRGLGSAGPASYQGSYAIITEDYYLQLAIEVGVIGLLLFGLLNLYLAKDAHRTTIIPGRPLVAALVGLIITNLFIHAWADSSTALTFWTIAGLALGEANEIA